MTKTKSEQGYTKGPWYFDKLDGAYTFFTSDDKHGTESFFTANVSKEDAALIAAAPELLESLKELLGHIEAISPGEDGEAIFDAMKAISKAEGGR